MRLHRFIIPKQSFHGEIVISDKDIIHQLTKVFRLKKGSAFIISDGDMKEATVQIRSLESNKIICDIEDKFLNTREPQRQVTLYCSILKKENFEWVVQKATEVGIARIIPLITERTVKLDTKIQRLEKIVKEAAEQSGRGKIPSLIEPQILTDIINESKESASEFFVCDPDGNDIETAQIPSKTCSIVIGPEGGFSEDEILHMKEAGWKMIHIGKLTLRGETAAIIASHLFVNA